MPVWKYNENVIYKIMLKSTEYAVGLSKTEGSIEVISFTKGVPYMLDLTFYSYGFKKSKEIIQGYTISKTN